MRPKRRWLCGHCILRRFFAVYADVAENEIKDIVVSLRASFNKDMVEMLAAVPAEEAYDEKVGNDWAKRKTGWKT